MDTTEFLSEPIRDLDDAALTVQGLLAKSSTTVEDRQAIFALLPSIRSLLTTLVPDLATVTGLAPDSALVKHVERLRALGSIEAVGSTALSSISKAVRKDVSAIEAAVAAGQSSAIDAAVKGIRKE